MQESHEVKVLATPLASLTILDILAVFNLLQFGCTLLRLIKCSKNLVYWLATPAIVMVVLLNQPHENDGCR